MSTCQESNFHTLSFGAIRKILNNEAIETPVLQILGYKRIPGNADRFMLLLNDGITVCQNVILVSQFNHLISSKQLEKFTIFKLRNYVCDQNKKIIVCLDVEILLPGAQVNGKISWNSNFNDCSLKHSGLIKSPSNLTGKDFTPSSCTVPNLNQKIGVNNEKSITLNMHSEREAEVTQPTSKQMHDEIISSTSFSSFVTPNYNQNNSTNDPKNIFLGESSKSSSSNYENCNISEWDLTSNVTASKQDHIVCPIASLTPYQNKWKIRGRIIYKSPIVNYYNQRGEGKYFSFYLLDESGEIRVTAFNEEAEKLYDLIELYAVYFIADGHVKPSKGNSAVNCDFEITFAKNTKIEPYMGDVSIVPLPKFNFIPIQEIVSCSKGSLIDVIGMCNNISDIKTILTKSDNKVLHKRELQLLDTSNAAVTVTLWGVDAENFTYKGNPVIALRNAKVSDYFGHSLNVSVQTMIFVNPNIKETYYLKSWLQSLNDSVEFVSVSSEFSGEKTPQNWKTLAQVAAEEDKLLDKADYFTVKATIVEIRKDKCLYQSCAAPECFKKVTDLNNGFYKCDKCNKEYNKFNRTLLLSVNIADFSDNLWAVAFREIGESIIGMTTYELSDIKERDEERYYTILSDLQFSSFIFKMRSKTETYNNISRLKTTILNATPVDPTAYTKKLLSDIKNMGSIANSLCNA